MTMSPKGTEPLSDRKPYSSPLRDAEAAATRARIVDAATTLFVRDGYGATPMRAIAQEAGVSVQTVNLHGPKHALLLAAYEQALTQSEGWQTLNEAEPMRSIVGETDLDRLLDLYSAYMTGANSRIAALVRALRAAADADPAVREVYRAIEERRFRSIREGVGMMTQRGIIPAEDSEDVATMLGLLVSQDTYLHFRDAGWPPERYQAWLRNSLKELSSPRQASN